MHAFLKYFRQHPWQRRALTVSLAAIVGVVGALALRPWMRDRKIVSLLGSADAAERSGGIRWAVRIAPGRPELVSRLEEALDSPNDLLFGGAAEVLNRLGRFEAPHRRPEQLDRYRAVSFAAAVGEAGRHVRVVSVMRIILGGRDNAHVRRVLRMAASDPAAEVRTRAAALAAGLADDAALLRLIGDDDPRVAAAGVIDAGLAGRTACAAAIGEIFDASTDGDAKAAAAFALARLGAEEAGDRIARAVRAAFDAGRGPLADKLLCTAASAGGNAVSDAVVEVLRRSRRAGRRPPATALIAAGKLGLAEARGTLQPLIDELAARREELTFGDAAVLAAALRAGHRLRMPPGPFVKAIRELWHPGTSLAMILALEALADSPQPPGPEVVELLRVAAADRRLAVPAAAAAVALFALDPEASAEPLRSACASEEWLAGDYVAWRLAAGARPRRAGRVAADLLGPDTYDKGARSAGAVLLAMLARGTPQAGQVRGLLAARLGRAARDPFLAGSYRCGLLLLGRDDLAEAVVFLAVSDTFPKRRALTALLLAGRGEGLDLVLGRVRHDPEAADAALTGRLMARVYAAVVPDMPVVDVDAPAAVRHWQGRLARQHYLIHRREILDRIASWSFRKSSAGAPAASTSAASPSAAARR